MTGSNKILTVSYGTFSCTLEGFDDPFGTMRGIAEYFRDLAADDRYFGAEPPTPDVEMLQNIAQKEANRRVEARIGDTGLALRQVAETDEAPQKPAAKPENITPKADVPAPVFDDAEDAEVLDNGPLAFDDDYLMADEPEDVLTVDTQYAAPAKATMPAESVAEKLRRIRAVVSRTIEPKETPPTFDAAPDAEGDAGAEPGSQRALSRTIAEITADLADEDDLEELEETAEVSPASSPLTLSDDAAEHADTSLVASIVASGHAADEVEADFDEDETDDAGNLFDEDTPALEDDDSDAFDTALSAAIASVTSATSLDDETPEAVAEEVTQDDAAPFEASDFDDIDEDVDEDVDEDTLDEDFVANIVASLSERKATVPLEPLSDTNGDVGRLLQETDDKFNEGDGIRRRRVISQMRAAVAATKADRILSRIIPRDEQEAEDQNVYRQDLTRAMTRRPSFSEVAKAEEAARPAPLVLVSSQRVDEIETPAPKPVNTAPKRVAVSEDTMAEALNFREFAANMGATELPDLLEAAAAYTAFVEGQPHFSRPEIMKRVARVDPALEVSREAGLRSFGQLLRQGKIHKLQRGQFTVPDTTRFNPTQRYAGE